MESSLYSTKNAVAYSVALGLVLAGLVFALCSVRVGGMDVLVDAVGWLLVFNGLRPLEKPGGGVGPRGLLCLGLLALSAAQLFLVSGGLAGWLYLLRMALEAGLFLSLIGLLGRFLAAFGWQKAHKWFALALALNALLSVALAVGRWLGVAQPLAYAGLVTALGFVARLLLAGVMVWLLLRLNRLPKTAV